MHWTEYFGQDKLQYAPCFDSRTVCYPNDKVLRDYLSWRQADCKCNMGTGLGIGALTLV